jgi:proteasome lid subunit RPN8/RPN11
MNLPRRIEGWLSQVHQWLERSLRANGPELDDLEIAIDPSQSLYADPTEISMSAFKPQTELVIEVPYGPIVGLSRSAVQAALQHTAAHTEVECGGLCLGNVFLEQGTNRLILQLTEIIPAAVDPSDPALTGPAHLTFTPETWQQLVTIYLQKYPERRILGWYHSHPGMDVFLSSMDLFIQNNFFTAPWQIAMVLEPLSNRVGLFTRQGEQQLTSTLLDWPMQGTPPSKSSSIAPIHL